MSVDPSGEQLANPYSAPQGDFEERAVPCRHEFPVNRRLILGLAAAGAITNAVLKGKGGFSTNVLDPLVTGTVVSFTLVGAAGGVGAALLFHAFRDKQFRWLMPGHWLLIGCLLGMAFTLLQVILRASEPSYDGIALYFVIRLVEAAFFVAVISRTDETWLWKYFAGCKAALALVPIGHSINFRMYGPRFSYSVFDPVGLLNVIAAVFSLAASLLFLAATIQDWRRGTKRDTWHWLGLGIAIAVPLLALANSLLWEYTMMR